jgi:hypothetical protein
LAICHSSLRAAVCPEDCQKSPVLPKFKIEHEPLALSF